MGKGEVFCGIRKDYYNGCYEVTRVSSRVLEGYCSRAPFSCKDFFVKGTLKFSGCLKNLSEAKLERFHKGAKCLAHLRVQGCREGYGTWCRVSGASL